MENNNNYENQTACFGKFHISWERGDLPERRLKDWLDPGNSGIEGIDGTYCDGNGIKFIEDTVLTLGNDIFGCSISMQNVAVKKGANVLFHAADNVEINKNFEVEAGATVQIGMR